MRSFLFTTKTDGISVKTGAFLSVKINKQKILKPKEIGKSIVPVYTLNDEYLLNKDEIFA